MSGHDDHEERLEHALLAAGMTRREILKAGGAGAAAFLFAAALPGRAAAQGLLGLATPRLGGSLTWGATSDPATLAPFGVGNTSSEAVKNLVYESLVTWDRHINIVPALAESWTTPNKTTYVFKLRKGVKFHSGKEFDSGDVVYSFNMQKTPPPPGTVTAFLPKIASVEAVDKYTVKFHMSQPDGTLLGYCAWLAYSFIVPNGFYANHNANSQVDGTGPYKLGAYVPNDHVTLVKNTSYWAKGQPYLNQITIKVMADEQSRVAALTSGAIDGTTLSPDTAMTLKTNNNLVVQAAPTAAFKEIEINLRDPKVPWHNVQVRKAVNYAINRQDIIDKVYGGHAQYSSKIPPVYGDWPLSQAILKKQYERYDLDEAQKLMRIANMTNGFDVTLQAIANPNEYVLIAQVIAAALKKINVNVTVQPLEIGTFAQYNSNGQFQWQSTGRGMRGDPSEYFSDFDPAGSTYKAWFQGGYQNNKLTKLLYQGIAETDPAKRHQIYNQLQEIVLTQWPTMPLVDPTTYQVVNKRVKNMYIAIDSTMRGLAQTWVTS